MTDDIKQTSAQRKQIKFSGLIRGGVIAPGHSGTSNKYVSEVLNDQAEDIPAATSQVAPALNKQPKILLALIDDSPYQPRIMYDPMEIDNLAHSMAAAGLEEPIIVREKTGGRYELIGGHRRTRSARTLGWTEITANIVDRSDREAELATMVSNEARVDLTDYERGKLYKRSQESGFAATQTDVANLFGTTQGRVSRCMAMLKLPSNYIVMLEEKPDFFGAKCAESITRLLKEYPAETTLIEDGVMRIKEHGASDASVTQWVQQAVKLKHRQLNPKTEQRSVIPDKSGRELFSAKFDAEEISIKIKMPGLNNKELKDAVLAALRQFGDALNE